MGKKIFVLLTLMDDKNLLFQQMARREINQFHPPFGARKFMVICPKLLCQGKSGYTLRYEGEKRLNLLKFQNS